MKRILVIGAGRSSSSLIKYLIDNAQQYDWRITVADASLEMARKKVGKTALAEAIGLDINDTAGSSAAFAAANLVISLLPPPFHPVVARRCLESGSHFLTASYISGELKALDSEVRARGLVFLNECGLDPGIDHMSAMKVIDGIRSRGGEITSFESFTGGLIAPETDPGNPWRYKFTWNPHNVVTAGQATARYLHEGRTRYIAYPQLFQRVTPVHVPGYGDYEGYANRDSLKYLETYGLKGTGTMLRGTLRHAGFCETWNILVQLGCCDDSYVMEDVGAMTHVSFLEAFLPPLPNYASTEEKLCDYFRLERDSAPVRMLRWSGFFEATPIGLNEGSPAAILEHILNKRWALNEGDRDQIVMWHRFRYHMKGVAKEIQASLVATGTDTTYTAMSQTVGLPLAIAARLIASDKIAGRGVIIPTTPEFYIPVLEELASLGIALKEWEV